MISATMIRLLPPRHDLQHRQIGMHDQACIASQLLLHCYVLGCPLVQAAGYTLMRCWISARPCLTEISVPVELRDGLNSHSRGHGPRLRVWELAGSSSPCSTASKRGNARGSLPLAVPAHSQPRSTGVATRAWQAPRQVSSAVSMASPKSADPNPKVADASWRCHAATPCRHPVRCQLCPSGRRRQDRYLIGWRRPPEPGW